MGLHRNARLGLAGRRALVADVQAEDRARADIARTGNTPTLICADVREWRPVGVDAIITDPPYITEDALDLYAALADFALDVLPDGGALVAMTDVVRLPKVLDIFELQERLVYRGTIAWTFGGHPRVRDWKRRTFPRWKPGAHLPQGLYPEGRRVGQHGGQEPGLEHRRPAQVGAGRVRLRDAHPELLRAGRHRVRPVPRERYDGVAALAHNRRFTGCDIDSKAIEIARRRLEIAGESADNKTCNRNAPAALERPGADTGNGGSDAQRR